MPAPARCHRGRTSTPVDCEARGVSARVSERLLRKKGASLPRGAEKASSFLLLARAPRTASNARRARWPQGSVSAARRLQRSSADADATRQLMLPGLPPTLRGGGAAGAASRRRGSEHLRATSEAHQEARMDSMACNRYVFDFGGAAPSIHYGGVQLPGAGCNYEGGEPVHHQR
jgi:hypothetical protein